MDNGSITRVTIGRKVKTIGKNAFKGAYKLKTVAVYGKVYTVGKNAFSGIANGAAFKIRANKGAYKKIARAIKDSGVKKNVKFKRIG